MRKCITAVLFALICALVCAPALAEWYCNSCGMLNQYNFCGICGAARPADDYNEGLDYHEFAVNAVPARLNRAMATRTGPGTKYTEPGTFFRADTYVTAVSKAYDDVNEIWWVQVDFQYNDEYYRAYTGAKRLDINLGILATEKQNEYLTDMDSAHLYPGYDLRYGPGEEYKRYPELTTGSEDGHVILFENGWALFQPYDGGIRYWVHTSGVQY